MAGLTKASLGLNKRTIYKLSGVLSNISYTKRIYLKQNISSNINSERNIINTGSNTKIPGRKFRPLYSIFRFQPKLFCSMRHSSCWNCGYVIGGRKEFCDKCIKLQPLDTSLNYFEVLGFGKAFAVDTKSLTKIFRKLQTKFHPDKFSLSSETEKQYALDHSSEINKAYRCLLNPVERALYLLDLAGQPLHEGQIDLDPEFLMEIMEVNEELAEASDKEAIANIGIKNQKLLDDLLRDADAAFSRNDIPTARSIVAKVKYYNNIYLKVKDYERQHGIID